MTQNANTKPSWLARRRRTLLLGGPIVFLIVALTLYLTGGRYMSTDNAYIQSARTQISANISARVTEIDVEDNQQVKKGDVLFKLDDRDYGIAVADAKAKLATAKLQVQALKATYQQQLANIRSAQATLEYQQRELKRQQTLTKQGISSHAQLDEAERAASTAQQGLAAAEQTAANARANLADNPNINVKDHPMVQQAQANLDKAELNLTYTTITAPADGMVTKVEQLQIGDYITAATPVFALVSGSDIWVEANFKETELTYMHPGQKATIRVDTYGGQEFHGEVTSVSPGTGSSFSLLPPENASGNWVKVVQRLPVRISITDASEKFPLRAGMSATVSVDTEHRRL